MGTGKQHGLDSTAETHGHPDMANSQLHVAVPGRWLPGREMLATTPCHRDERLVLGREMVTGREIAMLAGNLMIEALLQRDLRRGGCHPAMWWRAYAFGACSVRCRFQHGPLEMGMAGAGPLICTKSGGRDAVQGSRAGCREQTSRLNASLRPRTKWTPPAQGSGVASTKSWWFLRRVTRGGRSISVDDAAIRGRVANGQGQGWRVGNLDEKWNRGKIF